MFILALSLLSTSAFAQGGALCGTFDRELMIQVSPNNTLSLIDPAAPQNQQILAQFNQVDVNHSSSGLVYEANIRGALIANPNSYVAGARLSELQWVVMTVNTAPSRAIVGRGIVTGNLKLQKANGQTLQKLVTCTMNQTAFFRFQ